MARVEVVKLQVYFSDCDPLGIAGQSSYFRWYDAASRIYFERCGVPLARSEKSCGIIGTPLLEVASQFFEPLDPGDPIEIETSIVRVGSPKVFTQRHVLYRHGQRHAEGEEKRVFASRDPQTGRVYAIPIPTTSEPAASESASPSSLPLSKCPEPAACRKAMPRAPSAKGTLRLCLSPINIAQFLFISSAPEAIPSSVFLKNTIRSVEAVPIALKSYGPNTAISRIFNRRCRKRYSVPIVFAVVQSL